MRNLNKFPWKDFPLISDDMFIIDKCKTITTTNINENFGIFDIVGATSKNNGNVCFANESYSLKLSNKNAICLIKTGQGSVGDAVYKNNDFIPSNNVCVIRKNKLTINTGLFITTLINVSSDRYNYGYIRNEKRIARERIMLPIKNNGKPDWEFMEKYSQSIAIKKLEEYISYCKNKLATLEYKKTEKLENKKWKEFFLKEIFHDIQRGKRLTKNQQLFGYKPYISSTALNNGVDSFIKNDNNVRVFYNCLTIANSGSVGSCFYHPYEFVASDHITHLKNSTFDNFTYLFISNQLKKLSDKYNFYREINDKRISRDKIVLPTNNDGNPDYKFMSQYMKNLEYIKIKQYLNYIESIKSIPLE